jgi:hypothetical protein
VAADKLPEKAQVCSERSTSAAHIINNSNLKGNLKSKLMEKIYQPNFNDPRIRETAIRCLTFVELYVRSNVKWIARNEMYKHFGDTSKPLGRFLKNLVLITVDDHYNYQTGKCKRYRTNPTGVDQLKQLLGIVNFEPKINAELEQQIESGDFEYETKSNRSFNAVQFVPREIRGSLLANHGYRHNYDIVAAAPRLLLQRAKQIDPDFTAPALEQYIQNRNQVRDQIAAHCAISATDVKTVINAMLHGAYISKNSYSQILQQLNYNYAAIDRLQQDPEITQLRTDIRELWKTLRVLFPERFMTNCRGHSVRVRLSGRDKSHLYRQLEDQVGQVIRRYLKRNCVRCLWIHDGWCSDKAIDTAELCAEVRRQTGFVIELDWAVYE